MISHAASSTSPPFECYSLFSGSPSTTFTSSPQTKATPSTCSDRYLRNFTHYLSERVKVCPQWRWLCPNKFPQLPFASHRSFWRAHPLSSLACPATDGSHETTSLSFPRGVANLVGSPRHGMVDTQHESSGLTLLPNNDRKAGLSIILRPPMWLLASSSHTHIHPVAFLQPTTNCNITLQGR